MPLLNRRELVQTSLLNTSAFTLCMVACLSARACVHWQCKTVKSDEVAAAVYCSSLLYINNMNNHRNSVQVWRRSCKRLVQTLIDVIINGKVSIQERLSTPILLPSAAQQRQYARASHIPSCVTSSLMSSFLVVVHRVFLFYYYFPRVCGDAFTCLSSSVLSLSYPSCLRCSSLVAFGVFIILHSVCFRNLCSVWFLYHLFLCETEKKEKQTRGGV